MALEDKYPHNNLLVFKKLSLFQNSLEDNNWKGKNSINMPYNPLMLNNKKIQLPKEKPKIPKKSLREKLLCWSKLLLAALLAGGN